MIHDVIITDLKIINNSKGDIYHALKLSEISFVSFGEAYFSTIINKEIKGWKKHHEMTLNLVVPVGEIKFVLFDDRVGSPTNGNFMEVKLSPENYSRLTIPPNIWMAFQGTSPKINLLLNIASIEHDPEESTSAALTFFNYEWSSNE